MVTGYEEAIAVFHDTATFSSCNSVTGPFPGLPGAARRRRRQRADRAAPRPAADERPAPDARPADAHRAPRAADAADHAEAPEENEEFMWRLADRQLDEFVANGACEFISEFASPFALLVIADLLGVPEADHEMFRAELAAEASGPGRRQHRAGDDAQPAGVPLRAVHRLRRGPPRATRATTC